MLIFPYKDCNNYWVRLKNNSKFVYFTYASFYIRIRHLGPCLFQYCLPSWFKKRTSNLKFTGVLLDMLPSYFDPDHSICRYKLCIFIIYTSFRKMLYCFKYFLTYYKFIFWTVNVLINTYFYSKTFSYFLLKFWIL